MSGVGPHAEALDALRAIEDAGPPILLVDNEGRVLHASAAAKRLWHSAPHGHHLGNLFDLSEGTGLLDAIRDGAQWRGYLRISHRDGRAFECTATTTAADADASGICCLSLYERTAEAERLAELQAAHRRSLALLDAMPDLLFRISSNLTFLDYRDPTTKGLGVRPEEFLGKRLEDFLPPEIVELVEPNLKHCLETDEVVTYESYYDYEDGRHTFDNRVVKSGPDEVVLICRDTTEYTRAEQQLKQTQARFQRSVEYSREYTAITDGDNIIRFISAPVERILGYAPHELVGTNCMDLIHPEDLADATFANRRTLGDHDVARASIAAPLRVRLRHKSGEWRIFETTAKSLFDDGLIAGLLTHCRDITDYVNVETNLRDSLTRLDTILETAPDGILTFTGDGRIESMNTAAKRLFGIQDFAPLDANLADLLTPSSWSTLLAAFERISSGAQNALSTLPDDIEGLRTDGTSVPLSFSASRLRTGDQDLFTAVIKDMSDRYALQQQLAYQASHDALTGLPNRSLFYMNVEQAIKRATRSGQPFGIAFFDLDRFKTLNDSLGHAIGDQALCIVADRLAKATRSGGTVARFGGDEFLILCELKEQAEIFAIVNRLLASLSRPIALDTEEVSLGASAGIAIYDPKMGGDAETLIHNADVALHRAKEQGRGRYEVFDASTQAQSRQRLATENALRHAIERKELVAYYQPIYSLATGRYVGTEALLRWHRDGQLLTPKSFIDIAEESGLIGDIGYWILNHACQQARQWQKHDPRSPFCISVNVSGRQLDQPDFLSHVREILETTKIHPSTVTLEITETTLIFDDSTTVDQLHALKDLGVGIAIDDFGRGYSSLGYLRQLPIDTLKIDRSFISKLEYDKQTAEIVNTIIKLAHTLGMEVVAEGVETAHQLASLNTLGCDFAQGYFFARPANSDDIWTVLFTEPHAFHTHSAHWPPNELNEFS